MSRLYIHNSSLTPKTSYAMSSTLSPHRRPVAIDLFAGAGGFSLGMEQAGFDVLVAVENDPIHAATYAFNFPLTTVLCTDAANVTGEIIRAAASASWAVHYPQTTGWNGEIDLVFGGPPCQGFSIKGKRILNDERNHLIFHFCRLVTELSPRYFVMENVPGMAMGQHQVIWLQQLLAKFTQAGFSVQTQVLNAADFGVPQRRRRLFFFGAPTDVMPVAFPQPRMFPPVTVGEAIADLPDLDQFLELLETDEVLLSAAQLQQLQANTSRYVQQLRGEADTSGDLAYSRLWNAQLLTSSMRTLHSQACIQRFAATAANKKEPISHLRRLDINGLSHTLRAGTGVERGSYTSPRPIHPHYPRVISVREAARIHSFPDWFRLHQTKWHGFRQVGNAVPPLLAMAIGEQIVAALEVQPAKPVQLLKLGNPQLLRFKQVAAQRYWQDYD